MFYTSYGCEYDGFRGEIKGQCGGKVFNTSCGCEYEHCRREVEGQCGRNVILPLVNGNMTNVADNLSVRAAESVMPQVLMLLSMLCLGRWNGNVLGGQHGSDETSVPVGTSIRGRKLEDQSPIKNRSCTKEDASERPQALSF